MDKEKALKILEPHMRRTVKAVANMNGPPTEAICHLAAVTSSRPVSKPWTKAEWDQILASLDACTDRLEDWLALRD